MKNFLMTPVNRLQAGSSVRSLWAAVAVLGICVLAMGATLVNVNHRSQTLAEASIPLPEAAAAITYGEKVLAPSKTAMDAHESTKKVSTSSSDVSKKNPAAASSEAAQAVTASSAVVLCRNCGVVESVTPVTREGQGSGVGVVAGGVLGGVVGNQVGKGSGRTVATVLGAIGGGWAGNKIEKNMKKTTVYRVQLRMQDGTSRTLEQANAPLVGSKVTVDGSVLRPA